LERSFRSFGERAAGARNIVAPAALVMRVARPAQRGRKTSLDEAADGTLVKVRYYIDPATGQPHIYKHNVAESEV